MSHGNEVVNSGGTRKLEDEGQKKILDKSRFAHKDEDGDIRSRPIIGQSSGFRFKPYCLYYDGIESGLKESNLYDDTRSWENVDALQRSGSSLSFASVDLVPVKSFKQ
ncbi:tubulin-folding cofactor C [Tanacetum coccineum]